MMAYSHAKRENNLYICLKINAPLFIIFIVKKLEKALRGKKHLCFLDFEGTQFSHEMIAYGAVLATIGRDYHIKKSKEPIKVLVKSKNKIGRFVEGLTGITQADLDKNGVSFSKAILELKKYCGLAFKKCVFITFGNHDLRILAQSAAYNLDAPLEITKFITKNFCDYQAFISEFIKDNNNNPMSLEKYIEFFGLTFEGEAHDPRYDAVNLMRIYDAFLANKEKVIQEYMQTLSRDGHLAKPLRETARKLAAGEDITAKEYKKIIEAYFE